jgi:hypothetical protein
MAGPLLDDEGSFEFIPIDASRDAEGPTYGNTMGVKKRKPLIEYFPQSRKATMRDRPIHNDPEFESWTYGDPTMPKQGLRELCAGDFLVLYCGLRGWKACNEPEALYIIGYFVVKYAGTYPDLMKKHGEAWIEREFSKNYHIIHGDIRGKRYKRKNRKTGRTKWVKSRLILIKGGLGSRLLKAAARLSAHHKRMDKGGHRVYVLNPTLYKHFGRFTKLNAIQRSIPRWVKEEHVPDAVKFLKGLR